MARKKHAKRARAKPAPAARRRRRAIAGPAVCLLAGMALGAGVSLGRQVSAAGRRSERAAAPAERAQRAEPALPSLARRREAEEHVITGHGHVQAERWSDAFVAFSAAARLDPFDERPHVGLGLVYKALDYYEKAEDTYRRALALAADSPYRGRHETLQGRFAQDARVELARILCDFGKNQASLAVLDAASRCDPEDPRVWAAVAVNEIRLGRPMRAIPLLERFSQTPMDRAWGYTHLGRAHADAGDHAAAEASYRRALEIQPAADLAHLWLGQLLKTTGRPLEAASQFERFRVLRAMQTEKRDLEQAVARMSAEPGTAIAMLVRLAYLRHALGRPKEALIPLARALDIAPDDARLRRLYQDQRLRAQKAGR